MAYTEKIVMSIGGSLIVPQTGIDTNFLSKLNKFIRDRVAKNENLQFFLVAGGGKLARDYRDAGAEVIKHELTEDDLDWLGIHATRLNAHLLRTIFRDIAHPIILDNYETIRKPQEPVVVGSGWKPGHSTDYDAVLICEDYNVRNVINLSNIDKVYNMDPNKNENAKPIDKIKWADFRKIVGDKWIPGMNAPFDPIAARKAEELGVRVAVLSGHDFENLENYIDGKDFVGTVIE